jgi:hypothetical protein
LSTTDKDKGKNSYHAYTSKNMIFHPDEFHGFSPQ